MQHTTTTTWAKPVPDNVESVIESKLQELEANGITCIKDGNDGEVQRVISRTWSDLATAESWRDFVLSLGAITSVVNPVS